MHDIKKIISEPDQFNQQMLRRGFDSTDIVSSIIADYSEYRAILSRVESLNAESNKLAKTKPTDESKTRAIQIKNELAQLTDPVRNLKSNLDCNNYQLPNILDDSVPVGPDEGHNVEIERDLGNFDLITQSIDHDTIGRRIGFCPELGQKISGSRFSVMRGQMAKLHRCLGQLMLDLHTSAGYEEIQVPTIVDESTLYGTGQLPKFADDLYKIGDKQYLAPTSEVMLTNLYSNEIIDNNPIYITALTECFRKEAGSAGKDTKGLIRQHQFSKVELVNIVHPNQSNNAHEDMLYQAKSVLWALGLPFRVVELCEGDTGFSARKTFDIEVWMAGSNKFREISSISNCGDFQARRMNLRMKDSKINIFPHTLNGSGVAVGRCLAAVLEYYYDGKTNSIKLPEILEDYMKIGRIELS
jgi:seryl-tRNA synthetase